MEALAKDLIRESNMGSFPILLVPNMNNLFTVSQSLELILPVSETQEISVDQPLSIKIRGERVSSDKSRTITLENQFLNPTKLLDQDIKSVSPTQLFNIQENSDTAFLCPDEDPNLQKICESALLHESSRNVTLVSETQPTTLLDDIPHKSHSSFSESNEIGDLFVPIADQMPCNDRETKISSNKSDTSDSDSKDKYISDSLSSLSSDKNSSDDIPSITLVNDELNNLKDFDENSTANDENFGESHAIVVHLPEDSFYTTESLCDYKEEVELTKPKAFPLVFPTDSLDLSLIPVTSMDSLLLGNFTLLPNSASNIKFQVIENDGTVKRIRLNPVCHAEEPLTVCTLNEHEDSSESSSCPATPVVTEIVQASSEKPFRCELCNATFNRLGNYTRHKKIHMVPSKDNKRFTCHCGKHFIQRCDLTRHQHIHSGTEPHRCTTCGKGYIRHSDLVIHQRFHNKEKPFACSHCTKGFSQRGDLNRHLRSIHLQVKPLTCGHCHKKFAKQATLIRHIQINHRDILLNSLTLAKWNSVKLYIIPVMLNF